MVKLKISDVKGGYILIIELNGNESETFVFNTKDEMENFVLGVQPSPAEFPKQI